MPPHKKYKTANLKKFLLEISGKSLSEQQELLDKELQHWIGAGEQIDDVCIAGIRI